MLKYKKFEWTAQAQMVFEDVKKRLTNAPIITLPSFTKFFEVESGAFGVGIGAVLTQEGRPIAYFSEKLSDAKMKYSIYDTEFYVIVTTLEYWRHYSVGGKFILYSNYEALKFIQGQHKLNPRHAK